MTEDGTGARPVLEGDPPPPCAGQRHYAIAVRGEDGRKVWRCSICTHVLRPFHPAPWEDTNVSKLPLTDEQVHEIAEAVMAVLMPRIEEAFEHAYDAGYRRATAEAAAP